VNSAGVPRQHLKTTDEPTWSALNWSHIFWFSVLQLGVIAAPFTFTWSGLVVSILLYVAGALGISMGYHRLLTHRSFQTPKWIEYILTLLGSLANQGGPISWVAIHRIHHNHSDVHGDPHSPRDGVLWAHLLWWMPHIPRLDNPEQYARYVPDLRRDPVHRFFQRYHVALPILLAVGLYAAGQWWAGVGLSWLIWGMCVRTSVLYHATWFVNSATHLWGYRSFKTRDDSTNLWWVALLTFGEGWHNNHHAFPRSARHGLRWWEVDVTFFLIRCLACVGLAKQIQLPR